MARVLCTGVDELLVETRKMILERAGHSVISATNEKSLIEACETYPFDVAVIGQAISRQEKLRVYQLVRQHCDGVRVLELYRAHLSKVLTEADAWLAVPAEIPSDLAESVNALIAHSSGAKPPS